jgi:hypothetical protein
LSKFPPKFYYIYNLNEMRDHVAQTINKIYALSDNFIHKIDKLNTNNLYIDIFYADYKPKQDETIYRVNITGPNDNPLERYDFNEIRVYIYIYVYIFRICSQLFIILE